MSNGDGMESSEGGFAGFTSEGVLEDFKLIVDPVLMIPPSKSSKVFRYGKRDPEVRYLYLFTE